MKSAREIADRMIKHYQATGENPFIDKDIGGLSFDFCLFNVALAAEFKFLPKDAADYIIQFIDADFELRGEKDATTTD